MSRSRKAKGTRKKGKSRSGFRRGWYWTLLVWPAALLTVLVLQARHFAAHQRQALDEQLERLEDQYEPEIAELELQIELLNQQVESQERRISASRP